MRNGIHKSDIDSASYDVSLIVLIGMSPESRIPLRYE
jgi:hypothetical protein